MDPQIHETSNTAMPPQTEQSAKTPAGEKYQKRGFKSSEQVEKEGLSKGEKPAATTHEATIDTQAAESETLPEEFSFESAETGDEISETPIEAVDAQTSKGAEDEIIIGEKIFKDKKEAWAYAQELERQNLANDAFRQGIEAAQLNQNSNSNSQTQAAPIKKEIPPEFYTDPATFFEKREQQMATSVQAAIDQRIQQINTHQSTMQKFWADYPDLAKSKATMDLAQRHIVVGIQKYGRLETDKALKLIAEEARAEMRELGVTTLPTKPLLSNSKQVASSGTSTTVARPKPDEKPLNMVQQMKNIKNKRFGNRQKT